MKQKNRLFVLMIVLLTSSILFAQKVNISSTTEVSPTQSKAPYITERAIWDVQLNFDVTAVSGAAGNAGAEFDGTYFYTTRWAANLIHKYTSAGVLVESFSIPGVSGLRDLAFDGTYMYGGAAANTIYQMDFVNKTLIGTIASPVGVRNIAYDAANDGFWVANWSDPLTLVSRAGATIATIAGHGFAGMYGTDWDNVSPGGPYLWVFDQGSGAGLPQIIHQLQLPSGTATGVTHDVMTDIGAGNTSAIAGGLFGMAEYVTGKYSLGGLLQGTPDEMFVYEIANTGPPCPVGAASNPNPANGATNIAITIPTLSWTNPTGANAIEVYFEGTKIYDGALVTSIAVPNLPLNYFTNYSWKVVGKNDSCSGSSPTWTFKTEQMPGVLLCDYFETMANWTVIGPLGMTNWATSASNFAGGVAPELRFNYSPSFVGESKIVSPLFTQVNAGDPIHIEYKHQVNHYGPGYSLHAGYTVDGGTTLVQLWTVTPGGAIGPEVLTFDFNAPGPFQWYFMLSGDSYQINYWYIDDWCGYAVPVELTAFTATADNNTVTLNWVTATETNNKGFEIQRSIAGGEFSTLAFIDGNGTTTEAQHYTYTDANLNNGTYSYRLRQVDFDGSFEYSSVIEATVEIPAEFALAQNYPNPFNPETRINFSLAVDSKITLKIFDVLGQEVLTLVNGNLPAGSHSSLFNANNLNSGVYFYQIDATGVDGSSFTSVKKMILTK